MIWGELMRARIATLSAEIAGETGNASLFRARAEAYWSYGEFQNASSDLATAIRLDPAGLSGPDAPRGWEQWIQRAALLAYTNDTLAYKVHCGLMLDRFGGHQHRWIRQCVAQTSLLMPEPPVELSRILQVVENAIASEPDVGLPWFQITKALAEYRSAHYQQAIDWATSGRNTPDEVHRKIQADLIIALARYKLGLNDQAKLALSEAAEWIEKDLLHPGIDLNEQVQEWLICHILLREANELILQQKPATPRSQAP